MNCAQDCPSWISAFATVGFLCVAWWQFRNLIRSNTISLELNLESDLNNRKSKMDDISSSIRISSSNRDIARIEILEDDLEAAIESYLNILDRLAYCILHGYMKDRDWKQEYRDLITDIIRNNEIHFGTGTYYKKLKPHYENWSRT